MTQALRQKIVVPLTAQRAASTSWPVVFGVPFPRSLVSMDSQVQLCVDDNEIPCQCRVLSTWTDNSICWLNVKSTLPPGDLSTARLEVIPGPTFSQDAQRLRNIEWVEGSLELLPSSGLSATAVVELVVNQSTARPLARKQSFDQGPLTDMLSVSGEFSGQKDIYWELDVEFWRGLDLATLSLTLHNARRAFHKGGLWDLGDKNSLLLDKFGLRLIPVGVGFSSCIHDGETTYSQIPIEICQTSSGGENWKSMAHCTSTGTVPDQAQGFEVRTSGTVIGRGRRAAPSLRCSAGDESLEISYPNFWQSFPSGICCANDGEITVDFFPQMSALHAHELQPGERTTQSVILAFGSHAQAWSTRVAFEPPIVQPTKRWIAQTNAFPLLSESEPCRREFCDWFRESLEGRHSFLEHRELIDEYGWRNFGEVYADHENLHYQGAPPVVSHYNNQYDVLLGFLFRWLDTANTRWWQLASELARHVSDIDIYHTNEDRAAYNGGLFWHTDHYVSAQRATHRTYSVDNAQGSYGGGPASEHNYTTGLLCFYYLTGDERFKQDVLSLADWVISMDDGAQTLLGILSDRPTGSASQCFSRDYHGPSRGTGNSLNAMLDGWLISQDRKYLEFAEAIIRRAVHPKQDIESLDLQNVEARWSYTVFLVQVGRYLELKIAHDQADEMYDYTVASLLRFGRWMLTHEKPYLEAAEKLEYPTETWAAQDLRKANALRLAARYDETNRARMLQRADEITESAIIDWHNFDRQTTARAMAILFTESTRERYLLEKPGVPWKMPSYKWPPHRQFVSQRMETKQLLRSMHGWCRIAKRLARPSNWRKMLSRKRKWRN